MSREGVTTMVKRVSTDRLVEVMAPTIARRKIDGDGRELALQLLDDLEATGRIRALDATGYVLADAWVEPMAEFAAWAEVA
jgi:hypothetical protein